jgi:hypothetical protein
MSSDGGMDLKNLLQEGMLWILPLLAFLAAVICFSASRVSGRVSLLGVGFLLEALAGLGNRLVFRFMVRGPGAPDFKTLDLIFLVLLVVHLLGSVLIVVGLATLFGDVRRRLSRSADRDDYGPPPRPRPADEDHPWRDRPEGSRDIQR